jgi:hypothetical protein
MPLEVREIGISLSVAETPGGDAPKSEAGVSGGGLTAHERRLLVDECVRAVLQELARGRER